MEEGDRVTSAIDMPFTSMVAYDPIPLDAANDLLQQWQHKMGPCVRGNGRNWSHALIHERIPVAVTITSALIRETVGGASFLNRENCIELSRLCASRPNLCRVALRLWREFVFPHLGYKYAISYQDADLHNGNTYRFDGWKRIARSRSGTDSRSGKVGRDKWVWLWMKEDAK
jgi:antitoxin VapB